MLSIVSITLLTAPSTVPPCLMATFNVFSKFGALEDRSYPKTIWLQILKKLREEKNVVRELRRCDRGGAYMFLCWVMYIGRDKICYVHAQARYILLSLFSGLITCMAYNGSACGVKAGFAFYRQAARWYLGAKSAVSRLLQHDRKLKLRNQIADCDTFLKCRASPSAS